MRVKICQNFSPVKVSPWWVFSSKFSTVKSSNERSSQLHSTVEMSGWSDHHELRGPRRSTARTPHSEPSSPSPKYHSLRALPNPARYSHPDATRRAFIEPICSPGGHNVESVLEKATAASQSYPYFIQQQGQAIWNSATQQIITDDDVLAAGLYGAGNIGLRTETGGNSLGRRNRFLPENLSVGHHEDGSG